VTELDAQQWGDAGQLEPDGDRQLELEDVYDEMTLRRLGLWSDDLARHVAPPAEADVADRWSGEPDPFDPADSSDPPRWLAETDGWTVDEVDEVDGVAATPPAGARRARHVGLAGAMLAGAMLGLGDVLEPEKRKDAVIEPELLGEPAIDQPVQFIMVPGLPKASVVILRPWLRR
jgi:hypothetical protein